ncbi:hypothetical protein BW716_10450 [[Flexibacter] sp. ATCC 35208]|nr:hypothetical protein BW716_10450 [[Flexibacter] sp. ATCC 35208]
MNGQISITKNQYDHLSKIFSNDEARKRYGQYLIDSVSGLASAKSLAIASTEDEAFNPNLVEDNSIYFVGQNPPLTYISIYGDKVQYEVRPWFYFPIRQNNMSIVIRLLWDKEGAMANPHASYNGSPIPIITGPALGTLETPVAPLFNIFDAPYACHGNVKGDVIEKRTIARTNEGKYLFKAGVDASGLALGTELSAGVTIVYSANNISDFYYELTFRCDFQRDQDPNSPVVEWSGTGICRGTQQN